MGTWISHLRTAEKILNDIPGLNREWFYAGSIAPDCGMPDETWTKFDPPKSVTHYLAEDSSKYTIHDLVFYREYRNTIDPDLSSPETSFLWGYYFHLLTDRLWVERIDPTTKAEWASLFNEKGKYQAIDIIKGDWYDLDHRFLRDNPGWPPWTTFFNLKLPYIPIRHISPDAIDFQFEYIRRYYTNPQNQGVLDRVYPYMNERAMQRIVDDTASASLKVYRLLRNHIELDGVSSAVSLLPAEDSLPYPPPLGGI